MEGSDLKLLPQIATEVTIRSPHRTIVIKCKYTEALDKKRFLAEKFLPSRLRR